MYATRVTRRVQAPATAVYRALVDPEALAVWRVPAGMTARVHAFDAREGGAFRISLTYGDPAGAGKSGGHTDTYRGRFVRLVPGVQVVEAFAFETDDDTLRGTMTMTTTLTETDDGATDVEILHEGIPDGVPRGDNEQGTRMALDHLARLVEERHPPQA
ncbi:polyketide cyclase [Streptomyces bungoensis]|uniref:Polyketide cyclase n=1 Tax=Streptomyces bungoensis TaxID=285568 RepID=A0A101SSN9_9ACTN|nr:SRPBCC domain-containing protein [Streptomyces bungoensis]KUN79311.1 polyketide cyclase [Streptomyces bungoensis]